MFSGVKPVDPKSFFRIWLNKIQDKFKEKANINHDDVEAVNNGPSALVLATQAAALDTMALPLLFDCNRPPKRRTTDIKLKDLQLAKQALLNPSTDAHKETKEISVKRAGSVRNTIEKLKEITKDGNSSNYYDFVRKNQNSIDKVELKSADFTPKVIDVEAMVQEEEKEEKKKSKAFKATWNVTSSDCEAELRSSLEEFSEPQTPLASVLMLQVLYNIHKRIYDEPHVEKYYRIYIKGTVFERYVWQLEGASKFLQFLGWIKCGNYIVLSKSYPVATSLKVIESVLRRKKKSEGSINNGQTSLKHRPNVDVIEEDEVLASFTKIETDIDSGVEDGEASLRRKPKLRRVESKEHLLGEEEYVIVEFVGNVELSSRKSSRVEQPENLQLDVNVDEDEPESAIGLTPPSSQSPTSNVSSTFEDVSDTLSPTVEQPTDDVNVEVKADIDFPVASVHVSTASELPADKPEELSQKEAETAAEKPNKEEVPKSKGLKGLKNRRKTAESPPKSESPTPSDSPKLTRGSPDITSNNKELSISRSSSSRSISSRRSIDESGSKRGSPRTSSNTVLQNKLLFDQKISTQFKRSPSSESRSSTTSLNSLREGRKESLRGSNGRPVSGTVAGTLSMFEANSALGGRSKNAASKKQADKSWGASLESKPTVEPSPKTEDATPTSTPPATEEVKPVSTGKKKRFPFKKKKTSNISKDAEKSSEPSKPSGEVQLVSATPIKEGFQERAIDVPTEMVKATEPEPKSELQVEEPAVSEKKKKSGSLISRMKRRSRKSSSEHSDNELTTSVEIATKVEDPVIEETTAHLPRIVDTGDNQSSPVLDKAVSTDVKQPDLSVSTLVNKPDSTEAKQPDLSTSVDTKDPESTSLPEEDPPSPAQASEEVKFLLESIIDRKRDNDSSTSTKKKKLKLKKKSNSKKEPEKTSSIEVVVPPAPVKEEVVVSPTPVKEEVVVSPTPVKEEVVVSPTPVKEEVIDEGISENKITDEVEVADWPEEMLTDNNNQVDEKKADSLPTIEGELESPLATSELLPQISVEPANPKDDVTEDVRRGDGMLEVNLNDDTASSIYSPEDDSLSMTGSINTEKKKKKRFKFGLRKSSSKKNKDKQPQNELEIWEQNDDSHKLEKKHSSKKLKRPKSLDFLADVIHPTKNKEDKKQRPVSMAHDDDHPAPKSPTKRKTLSLFKRKKKHLSTDTSPHDRTTSDVDSEHIPSPISSSPDVFKIPDLVDGNKNSTENGHATLTVTDHSEHNVNTEMSLSLK